MSDLQEEEALRRFLDQLVSNVLGVKLCPELNQQGVVLLHILSCHLGLASNSKDVTESERTNISLCATVIGVKV